MKSLLHLGRGTLHIFMTALIAVFFASAFSHETTRRAHESSLDPREEKALAHAQGIAFAAPAEVGATPTCQLRIRLLDARSRKPLPGLVRVTQSGGGTIPLAGLVNRGTKLRNDHPAKDWFVLVEPVVVPVPRTRLTIEAFSG